MNEFVKVVTQNYANFEGRARRREYWMFSLVNYIISAVIGLLEAVSLSSGDSALTFSLVILALASLISLALFVPGVAVTIRRLHDTGRTGWISLIAFIPVIGTFIMIYFLAQDSQPGSNKWGPNPKGESVGAVNAQSW